RDVHPDQKIRPVVLGPLTLADLVCWRSAAGPGFRAGRLGFLDGQSRPSSTVLHPKTGWAVPTSIQHEDPELAAQRGMPAQFDNGVMRFAWVSPMLTNWMGDHGLLRRLAVKIQQPNLVGDVTWLTGEVFSKDSSQNQTRLEIRIEGTNQLGEVTTRADAVVELPTRPPAGWVAVAAAPMTQQSSPSPVIRSDERQLSSSISELFEEAETPPSPDRVLAHDLIALQSTERPDAVALRAGPDAFTYAELEQKVRRMARWLANQEVRTGDVIGLASNRSSQTLVALLATQRLGAAYLAMDPRTPPERAARMLDEGGASMVLSADTVSALDAWADQEPDRRALALNDYADDIRQSSDRPLGTTVDPDLTSYIMFTSGSTGGVGRAVPITYRALSHYVEALQSYIPLSSDDVYLHSASMAFSASVRQWAFPLSVGATVVLAGPHENRDPLGLFSLVKQSGVTMWDTVPSMLRYCVTAANGWETRQREAFRLTAVDKVILSGEPVYWRVIQQWRELMWRPVTFFNMYGQTETTGSVCAHSVGSDIPIGAGLVPVGTALGNMHIEIRDTDGSVTDTGPGEVYISGVRVAQGYLHAPEANARRFVTDEQGTQWCRTGDLGRWTDGLIEVLGRADDSVNMGGIRIALGEVSSALRGHPSVRDVEVRPDLEDDEVRSLSAFVETREGKTVTEAELREFAHNTLAPHMVPRTILIASALPRNTSGKVDRKALEKLRDQTELTSDAPTVPDADSAPGDSVPTDLPGAPRTALEAGLATAWATTLELDRVGIDDPFPDFGGNSLLALQLTERIRSELKVEIVLRDLFEAPTVRQLAERLEAGNSGLGGAVVTLQPMGNAPPLFCVGGIMGHPYHYLRLTDLLGGNHPCYGIEYPGVDGRSEPLHTMDELAAFFLEQIRAVQPEGPYLLVGYSLGGRIVYEMARSLTEAGEDVPLVLLLDSAAWGYRAAVAEQGENAGLLKRARKKVVKALPGGGTAGSDEDFIEEPGLELALNEGASEDVMNVYEAARKADRNHTPQPYDGALTLVRVEDSPDGRSPDPSYGWASLARGGVRIHHVGGEHLTLFLPGNVEAMAQACRVALEVAHAEMRSGLKD
ncbi:MAG: alpha/beta fold hydrolase, partial [Longimicrobiales bacterium]